MIYKAAVLREEFDGVKEYFVVNYNGKLGYVPKHPYQIKYDSHPKEIEIEEVVDDSDRQHLKQTLSSLIEDCYESGCSYPFTIFGKGMDGLHTFYSLSDEFGFKHRLYDNCILDKIPDDSIGSTIECIVSSIKGAKLILKYSESLPMERSEAMQKYTIGEIADFKVVSIEQDAKTHADFLNVKGRYGFTHRVYGIEPDRFSVNQVISCKISEIDTERNILHLSLNLEEVLQQDFVFISMENLANDIERPEIVSLVTATLDSNTSDDKWIQDLKSNYSSRQNHWIFSYLNYLDKSLIPQLIDEKKYEEAICDTELLALIAQWILESDFLSFFHDDLRAKTITKAECIIRDSEYRSEALSIIREEKQDDYVQDIASAVSSKGYIFKKAEKLFVACWLLSTDNDLIWRQFYSVEIITKHILNDWAAVPDELKGQISHFIFKQYSAHHLKFNDDAVCGADYTKEELDRYIRFFFLFIIVKGKDWEENALKMAKSHFFRHLFVYTKNQSFLAFSAKVLFYEEEGSSIFGWNGIGHDTGHLAQYILDHLSFKSMEKNEGYIFQKGVTIVADKDGIGFYHNGRLNPCIGPAGAYFCKAKFTDGLFSFRDAINLEQEPGDISTLEGAVSALRYEVREFESPVSDVLPSVGETVKVRVSSQNYDSYPTMTFVRLIDTKYNNKSAVIFSKSMSSMYVSSARDFMKEGYVFDADVLDVTMHNGKPRITLSIIPYVKPFESSVASGDEAVKAFLKTKSCISLFSPIDKPIITCLAYVIKLIAEEENDLAQKYCLYNAAKLCFAALGNGKSYYYEYLISFYGNIDRFSRGEDMKALPELKPFMSERFPAAYNCKMIDGLIHDFSSCNLSIKGLADLCEVEDSHISALAKALMALAVVDDPSIQPLLRSNLTKQLFSLLGDIESFDMESMSEEEICTAPNEATVKSTTEIESNAEDKITPGLPNCPLSEMPTHKVNNQVTEGNIYLHILDKGCYVVTDTKETEVKGILGTLPIKFNESKQFLLTCYANGCVNKADLFMLTKCTKGRVYKNGYNANYALSAMFVCSDSGAIAVDLRYGDEPYMKCIHTDSIEERVTLQGRGMEVAAPGFNYLYYYAFDDQSIDHSGIQVAKTLAGDNYSSRSENTDRISESERARLLNEIAQKEAINTYTTSLYFSQKDNPMVQTTEGSKLVPSGLHFVRENGIQAFIHFLTDGSYVIYPEKRELEKLSFTVGIPQDVTGYSLLQCYKGGFVNKFDLEALAAKAHGVIYKNGTCAKDIPAGFFAAHEDMTLVIESEFGDSRFLKAVHVSSIGCKTAMMLHGDQLITDIAKVISYRVLDDSAQVLAPFYMSRPGARGVKASEDVLSIVRDYIEDFKDITTGR